MSKIRILHTADIHLDCAFSGLPVEIGRSRRNDLRETFKKIIQLALTEEVDLIFLTGDIFESTRVSLDTINFIRNELKKISHQLVFIAPGNHDPYMEGSHYAACDWPENVHIFKNNSFEKIAVDKLSTDIFGIAHKSYEDKNNYLKNLRVPASEKIQIVLMHGSDLRNIPPGKGAYFNFNSEDVINCKTDYLALGHYHGYKKIKTPAGKIIAAYSGSPEILGFDELQEKGVIIGEISKEESKISLRSIKSRPYFKKEIDCSTFATTEQLIDKLKDLSSDEVIKESIVKIILTGRVPPFLELSPREIEDRFKKVFYYLGIKNKTLPEYDLSKLTNEKTARGEFVRKLSQKIEKHPEGSRERRISEQALYYGLDAFTLLEIKERL